MCSSPWFPLYKSFVMDICKNLSDLQLKSADGKSIVPAIIQTLQVMQTQFTNLVNGMKTSFEEVCRLKDEEFSKLSSEVTSLKEQIVKLEEKIDENDQYERRDTLIISGPNLPLVTADENCAEIVRKIAQDKLQYILAPTDISVAHRLGPKPTSQRPDKRKIIVKFCRRNTKVDLLGAARRMKPENIFINESLTPQRQTILFALRRAKKECPRVISGSSTSDGRVYVWVKPQDSMNNSRDTRLLVNSLTKLEEFCQQTLGKPMNYFLRDV